VAYLENHKKPDVRLHPCNRRQSHNQKRVLIRGDLTQLVVFWGETSAFPFCPHRNIKGSIEGSFVKAPVCGLSWMENLICTHKEANFLP
jgi:hypothetical protein